MLCKNLFMAFYSQICISQIRFYLSVSLIYQHIISFLLFLDERSINPSTKVNLKISTIYNDQLGSPVGNFLPKNNPKQPENEA